LKPDWIQFQKDEAKAETRDPKEARNPKSEPRDAPAASKPIGNSFFRTSGFGLLSDLGLRVSELDLTGMA
jgi:hypothetical protein